MQRSTSRADSRVDFDEVNDDAPRRAFSGNYATGRESSGESVLVLLGTNTTTKTISPTLVNLLEQPTCRATHKPASHLQLHHSPTIHNPQLNSEHGDHTRGGYGIDAGS